MSVQFSSVIDVKQIDAFITQDLFSRGLKYLAVYQMVVTTDMKPHFPDDGQYLFFFPGGKVIRCTLVEESLRKTQMIMVRILYFDASVSVLVTDMEKMNRTLHLWTTSTCQTRAPNRCGAGGSVLRRFVQCTET